MYSDGWNNWKNAHNGTVRKCARCGVSIDGSPSFHKFCKSCFIKNKREEEQREQEDFNAELIRSYDKGYRRGLEDAKSKEANTAILDAQLIDRLIRLCHPDKHGNSEVSNQVTQKLLAMRKK